MTADKKNAKQVLDDGALLDAMMADLEACDEKYRPTNYWSFYQKFFLPELKKKGLTDFRRRKGTILGSFGATDPLVGIRVNVKCSQRVSHALTLLLDYINQHIKVLSFDITNLQVGWVGPYFYFCTKEKFEKLGLDIAKCPASLFGNPEGLFEMDGRLYTTMHLQYCSEFADAARYIELKPEMVFCELGSGLGRNIEVAAHLFKEATFFIYDIPPQLYVANQYLTAVFGDRVIGYRDAVKLQPKRDGSIAEAIKGKIIIQPTWRMPDWVNTKIDVFWNSASFQEMEPGIVKNYLSLVSSMSAKWIYINAVPEGNYWGKWKPGRGGTKERVLEKHYIDALKGYYRLEHSYGTDYFLRIRDYRAYIFKRNK